MNVLVWPVRSSVMVMPEINVLVWPMRPSIMVKPVRYKCFSVAVEIKSYSEASQI